MIKRLRTTRITRLQLALVVLCSSVATAGVFVIGGHRSSVAAEAAAILHRHGAVEVSGGPSVVADAEQPGSSALDAGSAPLDAGTAPAPARTTTVTTAAPPTSATAPAAASTTPTSTSTSTTPASSATKTAKHVFVISLTAPSYQAAFGKGSVLSYLDGTLRPKGTLLSGYTSLSGSELPDELAMVSGQAPNADTLANCPSYDDFASSKLTAAGLATGTGCVYPNTLTTVADQVSSGGGEWGAYLDDMGTKQGCIHADSGAADDVLLPFAGDEYATRHNPFIYFHSLLDLGGCSENDLDLTRLPKVLSSAKATPQYVYIAPSLCEDASATSCSGGAPSGLAGEDAFLKTWVPQILDSAAYKNGGVLMITFAPSGTGSGASGSSGAAGTATAGAATTTPAAAAAPAATTTPAAQAAAAAPATAAAPAATTTPAAAATPAATPAATTTPGATSPTTTGTTTSATPVAVPPAGSAKGEQIGALVLSSSFGKAGGTVTAAYDPYSVLRSVEQLLGLTYLGNAKTATSFVAGALPGF